MSSTRLAFVFAILLCGSASALPITYIFGANVNGTLAGNQVAGTFRLTAIGDTNDVTVRNANSDILTPTSVTIDLSGQTLTLNAPPTYVFVLRSADKVGFGVNGLPTCCDIIQQQRAEYGTYDLVTSIGPLGVVNNLSIASFGSVPTSGGLLTLTTMESNTFQAIVGSSSVPEPASLLMAGSAAVALLALRLRRS